jgi:L-alanine-DL-glutamate epimerase-like enolase superfamily enzyme
MNTSAALLAWPPVLATRLEVLLLDEAIEHPVRTSFGTMNSRPGLLIRITADDGTFGVGEVWCNFPAGGARYKAGLATQIVAPALIGKSLSSPDAAWRDLEASFSVLALQCADFGSLSQLLAGVDQALWDLFSKRAGKPLWDLLGGRARVPVYASGIGPQRVRETITEQARAGHVRFKIKLGFGDGQDQENLAQARRALPAGGILAVDVNQGWSIEEAMRWLPRLADMGIAWCEEALRADTPWKSWRGLAEHAPSLRLAAGENLMGSECFLAAVAEGGLQVLQPDLGKWGGFSGNLQLARALAGHPTWLCPHWLAGGVGLMASLQFKAAIGGGGWVEVDANPNAQRTDAFASPLRVEDGEIQLPSGPGVVPELAPWIRGADWTDTMPP